MTKLYLMVAAVFGCLTVSTLPTTAQNNRFLAISAGKYLTSFSSVIKDDGIIDFCGENLPTNHPAIAERWSRTLSRQAALASSLALLKRRASVIFPLIEPVLKQYRIPSDFKYLPLLESAITNRAVSRRGAAGFWQLMPQTAQSLGLRVSRRNDERFNLQKATHAACRYLNELYEQLGSWMLVATAYNAGPNYIQQLSRQHPDVHPMALPYRSAETKAYLFQAVAVKELLTRPHAYRHQLSSRNLEELSSTDLVDSGERASILASFDMDEAAFIAATATPFADDAEPTFIADSTTTVVLLTEAETDNNGVILLTDSAEVDVEKVPASAKVADVSPVSVDRLTTRSLSAGTLAEGKLCLFQVVQPITINGRQLAVGDVVQAHIEIIDKASGRVFLRTDRLVQAQTQETIPLKLVATSVPRQPGVAIPSTLDGWQLTWEQL